jgi:hypothetical protein
LLRFGFRASDIAECFGCEKCRITAITRRHSIPPQKNTSERWRTNGAPFPKAHRWDIGIKRNIQNLVVNL